MFTLGPMVASLGLSFFETNLFSSRFVGLKNYADALGFSIKPEAYRSAMAAGQPWFEAINAMVVAHDPTFWIALRNTVVYAMGMLLLAVIPAFLVAWLLKGLVLRYGGMGFYRRVLPYFLGLILGDYIVPLLWAIAGVITGQQMYLAYPH